MSADELEQHRARTRARYHKNKKRHAATGEKWRIANKKKIAARAKNWYRTKKIEQAGRPPEDRCELCCCAFGKETPRFDHNHRTNAFRGWLCHHCNVGLGHFKDDP